MGWLLIVWIGTKEIAVTCKLKLCRLGKVGLNWFISRVVNKVSSRLFKTFKYKSLRYKIYRWSNKKDRIYKNGRRSFRNISVGKICIGWLVHGIKSILWLYAAEWKDVRGNKNQGS